MDANRIRIGIAGFFCLLLIAAPALGANYFVSAAGNDANPGTSADLPWRTLAKVNSRDFSPGDVVSFLRGSTWTGELLIHNSGTAGNPVTFTAYGTGSKPIIRNPGTWTSSVRIEASYTVLENFLLRDSHEAGAYITANAHHNVIRNCEFTNMGSGVTVQGNNNLITLNEVHDMVMVVNDPGGDNDFGANGFIVNGPNNEISYNNGRNLIAPSLDYGKDGGFVELYGNADGSYIHHNRSQNSDGFFEVGGNPGSARNVRICYNVSITTNGQFAAIHNSDQFASVLENFRVENNTVVDVADYGSTSSMAFWFSGTPAAGSFLFRNNIVALGRFDTVSNVPFDRSNNLYYFLDGSTRIGSGQTLGAGEIQGDPKFVSLTGNDFHLQAGSPAIDKGMALGYSSDFDGRPVPSGSAPDIGAYEYSGSGNPPPAPALAPASPGNLQIRRIN